MIKGLKAEDLKNHAALEQWFLYILECADGTLYTGITNDLERRFEQHNLGKGAKYTRTRRPVTLKYQETLNNRSEALIREYQIKQYPTQKKRNLINNID
ncbi:GIY-YIG nuclease family protein [bacterium]|nr:GIY-YIG nuclease family protein [bacterium]